MELSLSPGSSLGNKSCCCCCWSGNPGREIAEGVNFFPRVGFPTPSRVSVTTSLALIALLHFQQGLSRSKDLKPERKLKSIFFEQNTSGKWKWRSNNFVMIVSSWLTWPGHFLIAEGGKKELITFYLEDEADWKIPTSSNYLKFWGRNIVRSSREWQASFFKRRN